MTVYFGSPADEGYSYPPLVSADGAEVPVVLGAGGSSVPTANTSTKVGSTVATLVSGLWSMFAPRVAQSQTLYPGQPGYIAPLDGQPGYVAPTPIWVYALIPVGIIGVLIALKKSRRRSVSGYRKRRSRR